MRSLLPCLVLLLSAACGGVYMPSRVANFDPDGAAQIDDADVAKAFAAKPQMGDHVNVAYFSFDPNKDADVEKAIRAVPGVSSVYDIPALEATGRHRFDESPAPSGASLGTKKLRLLAARAHCDLLVVVDYARKTEVSPNALAVFDVLIVPAFFLPFRDVKVESAVDAFVIDVRNGYMYGHVALQREEVRKNRTIYADDDAIAEAEWKALAGDLEAALVKLADAERATPAKT